MKRIISLVLLLLLICLLDSCTDFSVSETAELEDDDEIHHITRMGLYAFCDCWVTSPIVEGVVQFEKDNKYGFMDTMGNVIIPAEFEITGWWSEGRGGLKKDGKWGFCDRNGSIVIDYKYEWAGEFYHGLAPVENDSFMFGYINTEGEVVIPFKYDRAGCFYEGLAAVKAGNQWGFIDTSDAVAIPFQFSDVTMGFQNDTAVVRFSDYGGYRYIDHQGNDLGPHAFLND